MPVCKHRPVPRGRAAVSKQRGQATMDTFSQRACMARFDEPIFCPSDFAALLAGLQYNGCLWPTTPSEETGTLDELDHDDDGLGGVRLDPDFVDTTMRDVTAEADDGTAPAMVTRGQPFQLLATTALPKTSSVLGSSQPRPQSLDTWEEEDQRRLRFALDGIDIAEVPRFSFPDDSDASSHGNGQQASTSTTMPISMSSVAQESLREVPITGVVQTARSLPTLPMSYEQRNSRGRAENYATSSLYDQIHIDDDDNDDSLPVDDPKRSYDVLDFLEEWRTVSTLTQRFPGLPDFDPGSQSPLRVRRQSDFIDRSTATNHGTDIQGISWHLIGPTKEEALTARALLHPSKQHARLHTVRQEHAQALCISRSDAQNHYRFRNFCARHRADFSHYQLRNVLAATGRSELFYSAGSKVTCTSLASPTHEQTVMDLSRPVISAASIRITCLATAPNSTFSQYRSDNVLVAGGFFGEYALLNLGAETKGEHEEGFITNAYNGLVTHVHTFNDRRSGLLKAAFCSNNHILRLMDTHTLRFTDSFGYAHAINCSATAPDGRLRALVGDSRETLITNAEKGDTMVTLAGHTDHAFACAWSNDCIQLATGAEDGQVLVWDARNWSQPLRHLSSIMSCARSLHYTDDGALVVAEQDDVVSIYNTADFTNRQDIRFFGSIAGVALLDGGAELAIANADKTVGGLLTFQRTAQGRNGGTFGARMDTGVGRRQRRDLEDGSDFVSGVAV